jgi:hypothetical protein
VEAFREAVAAQLDDSELAKARTLLSGNDVVE